MFAIEVINLTKYFNKILVLNNTNLQLDKNAILNISGPSGSGKTTLLRCIAGLEKLNSGTIKLNDKIVQSDSIYIPPYKRRIGMVFQDLALWPHLTAYQNIDFVSKAYIKNNIARKNWNDELLTSYRIGHKKNKLPGELSGGEQQRVAIVRAIANNPEILLLDEPFSHLDKTLKEQIKQELERLVKNNEKTVIIVSHNQEQFENFFTHSKVLKNGVFLDYNDHLQSP